VHARNFVRAHLPAPLKPLARHSESNVWCTESAVYDYEACEIDMLKALGGIEQQPMPSPIHFERLIGLGALVPILDVNGLVDGIVANLRRRGLPVVTEVTQWL
jgi:hypothetical protein